MWSLIVRKLTFDPAPLVRTGSKVNFRSVWKRIKSEFSNKSRHVTIKFGEKLGWIKSETACICFTWPTSFTLKTGSKVVPPRTSMRISFLGIRFDGWTCSNILATLSSWPVELYAVSKTIFYHKLWSFILELQFWTNKSENFIIIIVRNQTDCLHRCHKFTSYFRSYWIRNSQEELRRKIFWEWTVRQKPRSTWIKTHFLRWLEGNNSTLF